ADQYGRSILAQIIFGARNAMLIGIISVLIGGISGGVVGLVSGYFGGPVDMILMRCIDVLMLFPGILLALLIAAALGPSLPNEIVAVGVASIPAYARVMRGQVLAVRSRPYIDAAVAVGIPPSRILWRHIVPNALAPMVVLGTIGVGTGIVLGASLSFLGLGPTTGVPDWGRLLAAGEPYLNGAWWISTFPGLVVTLVVVAINILGDRLRDVLDVSS
ncbi:MAG: ABC transporter permease, partial [Solirubrobacteraceae bacterium]